MSTKTGVTKQYLRFSHHATFGVIASPTRVKFISFRGFQDRFVLTSACEDVYIWDTRNNEKVMIYRGDQHEVTSFARSNQNQLAVGYSDGSIRLFDIRTGESNVTFSGHKSSVTCLEFNDDGAYLASGSKDTDIVIWDIVSESGLFRLKGHKGVVTRCRFMRTAKILVSSSKDSFLKFWDLDTQHCFKTLVGHRSEIWDFVIMKQDTRLITGTSDSELRFFSIEFLKKETEGEMNDDDTELQKKKRKQEEENVSTGDGEKDDNEESEEDDVLSVVKVGSIMREGKDRVYSLGIDSTERLLGCHGSDNSLEIFKLCSEDEIKKRIQKKLKKQRKRQRSEEGDVQEEVELITENRLVYEMQRLNSVKAGGKVRGFDVIVKPNEATKIIVLLSGNALQLFGLSSLEKSVTAEIEKHVMSQGHRSDVRTLSFSSDNIAVLSASGESAKVWNRESQKCICSTHCEYALCSLFAPGDRHYVIGTKTGKLQLFDLSAGTLLETIEAHQGPVWSICLYPDQRGIVSGSEDQDVKFWEFELMKDVEFSETAKRLSLIHTRTLKMSEGVLCVRISPDHRLLAVSLLDSTVKIFFMDTLKFFLSLYGHKFPVLAMDISYDSTLIATGSADRNVKIWGLDFGDCHKSIFAHDDSIMCLQFVPKTHMFFTGGKDKMVKQWDADNFQKITTLKGHHGEVWALACSPDGRYLASASHDKSVRLWKKTEEILVLSEEMETEREAEFEKGAVGEETVIPGETNKETGLAAKKTIDTVKSTEKLAEALDVYAEEMLKLEEHKQECRAQGKELPPPQPNPLMSVYNTTCPLRYMLEVLQRIKSSELEQSLLTLPFNYACQFLKILSEFIDKGWEVELTNRSLFFLLRIHYGQITTSRSLLHVINKLRKTSVERLQEAKDVIGFNLAGLNFLQHEINASDEVALFTDATERFREKKKKKKKVIPILAV